MSNARMIQALVLVAVAGGALVVRIVRGHKPKVSADDEVVQLTPDVRARLTALRAEPRSWDLPEGETLSDKRLRKLNGAIDSLLDAILAQPDGPLEAADVAGELGIGLAALKSASPAATARAWGYMVEVWYSLGFRSPTGYFSHAPEALPPGWGEPLPPGWVAPDQPRPIGTTDQATTDH